MNYTTNHIDRRNTNLPWVYKYGCFVLAAYVSTSIFYIFPSGNPQPADLLMFSGIALGLLHSLNQSVFKITPLIFSVLAFGIFTFSINLIHFMFFKDLTFIKSSLYYLYNGAILIFVIWLFKRNPQVTWNYLYVGVIICFILEFLYLHFMPNARGFKLTGTFFNPNQLAKWSLVMASILIIMRFESKMKIIDYFIFLGLGYLILVSLSKAGLICYILMAITLGFSKSVTKNVRFLIFTAAFFGSIIFANNIQYFETALETSSLTNKAFSELEGIGQQKDESLEGRNYTRIFNNPQYILLGAGEGGYSRFQDSAKNLEIHSGLGTLIFSYGIFGTFLFFTILYQIVKNNNWYVFFLVALMMIYGLVHQNIRFSHFWLFLGTAYSMRYINTRQQQNDLDSFLVQEHNQNPQTNHQNPMPLQ